MTVQSRWRKSTFSADQGNCVELADTNTTHIAIRDSKDPAGPMLVFTRVEMAAFLAGCKDGQFDDLVSRG